MKKIISIAMTLLMTVGIYYSFSFAAYADSSLTVLNDCSNPAQFQGQAGLIYGAASDSPDGKALSIDYEYGLTFNMPSNVPKENRAADASKKYLCFWIKTPYSENDSGIFIGLLEDSKNDPEKREMIWNGNEAGYSGQIITVSKSGEKAYMDAGRLLVLKPGFEGYVAIPLQTGMAIHPGWANDDKVFDYGSISEIQIWFDGSHVAYDMNYCFDNFVLAADENSFISMVESAGVKIQEPTTSTDAPPASSATQTPESPATSSQNESPKPNESSQENPASDTDSTVSEVISDNQNTSDTESISSDEQSSSGWLLFLVITAIVIVAAGVILLFIYKPKKLFKKNKSENE